MAGTRVIDLSLTLAEELPCSWATHMPFQHKTFTHFGTDLRQDAPLVNRPGVGAYQTRWMLIDEHTGTHVDAPAHFIPHPVAACRTPDRRGPSPSSSCPSSR